MISRQCAEGLHGFCKGDVASCACDVCHLGPCTRCGRENLQKMFADGTLCADCYRSDALATPHSGTPCTDCGAPHAFRNPGQRSSDFRCASCHAAAGHALPLTSSVQGLVAACHGADVGDKRHDWAHVKGNTFGCIRCKAKVYDPELRKEMRRRELNS